jgi:hypothetical protein
MGYQLTDNPQSGRSAPDPFGLGRCGEVDVEGRVGPVEQREAGFVSYEGTFDGLAG